jgi:hypothetical protein
MVRGSAVIGAIAVGCTLIGCAPSRQGGPAVRASTEVVADGEIEALVAAHNERVSRLATFESRGSLEFRYSDADGEHFEQCEADVFLAPGGRGAVRATKVSSNLLWAGSDGTKGWLFMLEGEPRRLTVFEGIANFSPLALPRSADASVFAMLSPPMVRALGAMQTIPAEHTLRAIPGAAADAPVEERVEVVFRGFTGVDVAIRFGRDGLPASVSMAAPDSKESVSSTLSDYVSAPVENLGQGGWPKVPRKVEIAASTMKGSARIYLDAPTATAKRMKPRFFVLDDLVAQLRPDSVEHVVVEGGTEPAG